MLSNMSSEYRYKRLIIDPRCFKPASSVDDRNVYVDAIEAIDQALKHPHILESEKRVLENMKQEIRKNRFSH